MMLEAHEGRFHSNKRVHGDRRAWNSRALVAAGGFGLVGAAIMLILYFGVLTLVSGWDFTVPQFNKYWPFIVALATGFGIQSGLFAYLRTAIYSVAPGEVIAAIALRAAPRAVVNSGGKVVAATGTTSGTTLVSCCAPHLANLSPTLGATGLVSFIATYQTELFWFAIAINLAGIGYIGSRVIAFVRAN